MTNQRRSKTRNQMKRERIRTAAMALVLMALWLVLASAACKVWATHPAEQPVGGAEYLESIRNGGGLCGE